MADENHKGNIILLVVHKIEDWLLILFTAFIVVFSALQIVLRNLFDSGITWISPLLGVLVFWIGMLGALVATRDRSHIKINVLSVYLSEKQKVVAQVIVNLFAGAICLVLAFYALEFLKLDLDSPAKAFANVPVWVAEVIMPATFALMGIRFLAYAILHVIALVRGNAGVGQ
jgi:TRAP-type C4-dicarboxylate transport system permease small subunit